MVITSPEDYSKRLMVILKILEIAHNYLVQIDWKHKICLEDSILDAYDYIVYSFNGHEISRLDGHIQSDKMNRET